MVLGVVALPPGFLHPFKGIGNSGQNVFLFFLNTISFFLLF